jgi:hypothetical protein
MRVLWYNPDEINRSLVDGDGENRLDLELRSVMSTLFYGKGAPIHKGNFASIGISVAIMRKGNAYMDFIKESDKMAEVLVAALIPYLPPQSQDVANEYEAGEYVAAAHGAIHDLGILRADLPETLINGIDGLIKQIKIENDSFNLRFLHQMETGLFQLNERLALTNGRKMA